MQVLSIHNKYQIRGGEDESRESEELLLREMGHHVDLYEEDNNRIKSLSSVQTGLKTIWSAEAYAAVTQKLRQNKYDLVHVQNFFPLISPSVHYAAKHQGVPVIQTLRNYRLLCPNALFFRNGQVCEDCIDKTIPYPGIQHACYRENRRASAVTASMLVAHRAFGTWTNIVDKYITLTNFARDKFIQGGFPENKIIVKPNFIHPDPGIGEGKGQYALYVGRLSVEKGLDTLLNAWRTLDRSIPLKIVGDGPLKELVTEGLKEIPQLEYLGRKSISEVHTLMGNAMFLIFPSKWYETFGRVAVESFAKGTPVIAANIGAISELVKHGYTGLHFTPGDVEDLVMQVEWLLDHPKELIEMRKNVRNEYEEKYTAEKNYRKILEIYKQVTLCKD